MPQRWLVLASVACGTFMATLDSSIVNIALPTLTKELGADLVQVKWVIIIYLLVITCLLLPFGRISDQYGRRKVFLLGFGLFSLGSLLCGLSPALIFLILSRVIQAIGAAMLMANGPAIITATFSTRQRGTALGSLAMVVSAGLVSGPSVGGALISHFGWSSIFLVNLPVALVGMYLAYRFLHPDAPPRAKHPFDWAGAFLQTLALISFIVVFDPPNISVSGSMPLLVPRWLLAILTVTFFVIFFRVESEAKAPLFDLSLLRSRAFSSANLAAFLTFVAYSSVTVLMPFFLEGVLHYGPDKAGLLMTAIPLTIFVVAPISGRLSDRFGSRELSFAGTAIVAISLFAMAGIFGDGIDESVTRVSIVLALCSVGLALGLFQAPNNNAIMSSVPPSKLGMASALLATIRNLGLVTGTGLATTLLTWRMNVTGGDFVASLHFTHLVAGFIAVGAVLASVLKPRERRMQEPAGAVAAGAPRPVIPTAAPETTETKPS